LGASDRGADPIDTGLRPHGAHSGYVDASNPDLRHDLAVRMAELAPVMAAPRTLEQILRDVGVFPLNESIKF
jgi:hypothetical protein